MRFLLSFLLIVALSFLTGMFLPWWSIAVVAFLVCLFIQPHIGRGFLAGFVGVFILWCVIAIWIDLKNESILSQKIAQIFPLGGSSVLLIVITGFIGALVAGFAAMAGSSLNPAGRRRR